MAWLFFQELGRKVIHLLVIVVLIVYYLISKTDPQKAQMVLIALLLFFLITEYLRLELNIKIPFFHQFIRPKEQNRMHGSIFFLAATIICLAVFDFRIALAALLMITLGDTTAAIVGKRYGTTLLFRNKTVVGALSELCVNLIICFIVLLNFTNIYIIIIMAFTATIVETLVDELDDNLMVPLFSGFIGQLLSAI